MKFLGLKWRFLRIELERESLPSLPKRPVQGSDPESELSVAKSAVLDTYLRALQLTGVDDLQSFESFDYSTVVPVSLPPGIELKPSLPVMRVKEAIDPATEIRDTASGSGGGGASTVTFAPTHPSSSSSASCSSSSSQLTEADLFRALRHMQIFQQQELHPAPGSSLQSPRALSSPRQPPGAPPQGRLTPRPPPSGWASSNTAGSISSAPATRPSKKPVFRRRTHSKKEIAAAAAALAAEDRAEKMRTMDISKLFKQHALENNLRVPKCVAKAAL